MSSKVVIGAGFGDEGKGLVTDWLCRSCVKPLVIRFSGGQQAGHTVVAHGLRHVFSNFGAGTLQGAPAYFSRFCTVDPVAIVNELNVLRAKGVEPLLSIDAQCPVTTPYDIACNQHRHPHGTCGAGVGDTLNREEHYYSLTFADLFYPWTLETRLDLFRTFFYEDYAGVSAEQFVDCCATVASSPFVRKTYGLPHGDWSDLIYEGSQGLMLDQRIGFFPYVTRSNTGTANAVALHGSCDQEVYLVTRAYQTRHGPGPLSNERLPHNIKENPQETNVCNPFQGALRRSLLDVSMLEYAIGRDELLRSAKKRHLVITCLDHVEDELRFTWRQEIVCCDNEAEFVGRIAERLGFASVFVSSSDDGRSITQLRL